MKYILEKKEKPKMQDNALKNQLLKRVVGNKKKHNRYLPK